MVASESFSGVEGSLPKPPLRVCGAVNEVEWTLDQGVRRAEV